MKNTMRAYDQEVHGSINRRNGRVVAE